MNRQEYFKKLISIKDNEEFTQLALSVFHFQAEHNKIYSQFIRSLGKSPELINTLQGIPFLPVELFKSGKIITGDENYQRIFTSSGTTGEQPANHFIKDTNFYTQIFTNIFSSFYGHPSDYTIIGLLPSYLEREGSSLIFMMEKLVSLSLPPYSGFYLHDFEKLYNVLINLRSKKTKTILFGVTFALIDFIASYKIDFPDLIVMETGGMKGRKKEMIREEVHQILCKGFGVKTIHSEYGMTELLSQAYSSGNGIFKSPPWMKIFIRDPYDPLKASSEKKSGGINIVDLANIDSCSFLATQDLGKIHNDDSFEVLGRFDFSDVRGCNLLYS